MINATKQTGYTLIELLLYVGIVGSLLAAVSLYFAMSTDSRVKNQSIAEVNQQGALVMDRITQTVRGANSITSPAAGATADSLTLVVPTGLLSPTIFNLDGSGGGGGTAALGFDQDGGLLSEFNGNTISATKVVASVSGTVSTLHALIGQTASSGNDKGQMAIYSGALNPSTLLGNSLTKTLAPNAWNSFSITPVSITAGQTYWICYNTSFVSQTQNNLKYRVGASGQSATQAQSYGSWPGSWLGSGINVEYSVYAEVATTGASGAMQVKEGTAAVVPLTNGKVELSNLSFKNLTRSGTPGVVQISFTISRLNPNNRNEYDYQKTFVGTAALRP
jgi:type II secretory pathway pseudopilin PulG